jgi:hypothetical protein
MSWQKSFVDRIGDILRFIAWGCLVVDGILLSLFSVWFIGMFLWRLAGWLNRWINRPW